jgi:hypothetical protein
VELTKTIGEYSHLTSIFFVIPPVCQNSLLDVPCRYDHLGEMIFTQNCSILPSSGAWPVQKRILDSFSLDSFISGDLDNLISGQAGYDIDETLKSEYIKSQLPCAKIFFYCALCICSVQAALQMSYSMSTSLLQCLVRVDDRILSRCSQGQNKCVAFKSIIDFMDSYDSGIADPVILKGKNTTHMNYLDRPWIEERLYELDGQQDDYLSTHTEPSTVATIFAQHRNDSKIAGVVIIGESEQCKLIMRTPPFPTDSRPPVERGVYRMYQQGYPTKWKRKFLGTFTSPPSSKNEYVEIVRNLTSSILGFEHTLPQNSSTTEDNIYTSAPSGQPNWLNSDISFSQHHELQTHAKDAVDDSDDEL